MSDTTSRPARFLTDSVRRPYFWGIVAIVLLLLINVVKDPTYLAISISPTTGNLVGNTIDILRAAAPIMMIAVGMCLVVATGGIDLSVGSVMVVAGAVSMEFLQAQAPDSVGAAFAAFGLALLVAGILGAVNGVLVSVVGPPAVHQHPRHDARRTRPRQGHHRRPEHRRVERLVPMDRERLRARPPGRLPPRARHRDHASGSSCAAARSV